MARLTIYKDNYTDTTAVSNLFIDEYMTDANDAQLKVYLYLLRTLGANQATSVSEIADKFNHTEKDVNRALKYWEKKGLLQLDYDEYKNLTGIHLRDLNAPKPAVSGGSVVLSSIQDSSVDSSARSVSSMEVMEGVRTAPVMAVSPIGNTAPVMAVAPVGNTAPAMTVAPVENTASAMTIPAAEIPSFTKPNYTLDQLREFKNREQAKPVSPLFVAEAYIGKTLSPSEIKTIFFFTDQLHFSDDLIDYLLQYCVDRGKKDFRYIEKVAINWAEEGITTPKQAQKYATKYDKNVYAIMKELGKNDSPTSKEMEYINRWTKEYGFSTDIIFEACERTVLATDRHRFEYAEGILSSWRKENVHHKSDIRKIDDLYQKSRSNVKQVSSGNKFNQFTQNNYNFDELEKELLSN